MQCLGFESSNRVPARRPKEVWNQTRRALEHIFARHTVRKYVPAQPSRPGGTIPRLPWDVRQCTARCLQGWTALLTKSSTVHMKTGRGRTNPRGSAGIVARTQCSEKLAGMLAVWSSLVHSGRRSPVSWPPSRLHGADFGLPRPPLKVLAAHQVPGLPQDP